MLNHHPSPELQDLHIGLDPAGNSEPQPLITLVSEPGADGTFKIGIVDLLDLIQTAGTRDALVFTTSQPTAPSMPDLITFADDRINIIRDEREVLVDGVRRTFSPREYSILALLGRHYDTVIASEILRRTISYGTAAQPEGVAANLIATIRRIRKKLGPELKHSIQTCYGVGFMALSTLRDPPSS